MRGTAARRRAGARAVRFIPAHAGNGRPATSSPTMPAVHPRACGERFHSDASRGNPDGSSPRMRGTAVRHVDQAHRELVHPRACGERATAPSCWILKYGSSPRMRGTEYLSISVGGERRFIPAHAGNGPCCARRDTHASVHPRACGERSSVAIPACGAVGSSPRMRGTGHHASARTDGQRFIPAHAGNGAPAVSGPPTRSVHPRACGERFDAAAHAIQPVPVHPRACGERAGRPDLAVPSGRFIPAHAGNGGRARSITNTAAVHPRACGERRSICTAHTNPYGSSPRMRGTVRSFVLARDFLRFIPAHAGNGGGRRRAACACPVHPRACGERLPRQPAGQPSVRFIPAHAGNGR